MGGCGWGCRWGGVNRSSGLVVMVMCSQGSVREIGVPRVTECADWQQGLGIELVWEVTIEVGEPGGRLPRVKGHGVSHVTR